jgi:hypothetical protein
MLIQSVSTGRIYMVLASAGQRQVDSGKFVRVDATRAKHIKASLAC